VEKSVSGHTTLFFKGSSVLNSTNLIENIFTGSVSHFAPLRTCMRLITEDSLLLSLLLDSGAISTSTKKRELSPKKEFQAQTEHL